MASPSRLSASWRALVGAIALLVLFAALADTSEARRFRFGTSGGGSNSVRIEKVYELPRIEDLKLDDGRYVDIGRIKGGTDDGKLVGYVGPGREYLNLPYEQMTELVRHGGFDSVEALERHLAAEKEARQEQAKAEAAKRTAERRERQRRETSERRAPTDAAAISSDGDAASGLKKQTSSVGGTAGAIIVAIITVVVSTVVMILMLLIGFWPVTLGIIIYLVFFRKKSGGADAPAQATPPERSATSADGLLLQRAPRQSAPHAPASTAHSSASGDFAALAGATPVSVRYASGSLGSASISSPEQLALLLGQPAHAPGAGASPSRGNVAQPVSRRGSREGRIAQPRAFGKRG